MARYNSDQKRIILEAAITVFADKGLDGATIRLVGLKAGINSALIYYYFENKQKLFEEAIRIVMGDLFLMLAQAKRPTNARERIMFLVDGIFDYYATRKNRMRLMITVFNLHTDLLAGIIRDILRGNNDVIPLSVLQEGISRGELKPFAPIQVWWSLLGVCVFTLQAEQIASRLDKTTIPWGLPPFDERKKQIVELLSSGLIVSNN